MLTTGFWIAETKLLGPAQPYVTPEVLEFPVSAAEVVAQLNVPTTPAVAPGAALF